MKRSDDSFAPHTFKYTLGKQKKMLKIIMESITAHKIKVFVLICPKCKDKYYSITSFDGKWLCYNCKYNFGEIENMTWNEEEVDTIFCDKCKGEIKCTPDNFNLYFSIKAVVCPICGITVALLYRNKWRFPITFLYLKNRDGILEITTYRERIAFYVLNHMAREEMGMYFRRLDPKYANILWNEGKAIGYYTSSKFKDKPCLTQIYITPKNCRKGYAHKMVNHFINNSKGKVWCESPNNATLHLLLKIGLVKKEGEKYKAIGRLGGFM